MDPIYVWIERANILRDSRVPFQWDPQTLHHPETGEEVYGAGIQNSLLLRTASHNVPATGKVALLNLSWDGGSTGFGGRSAVPICVQMMNVNSSSAQGVGLV